MLGLTPFFPLALPRPALPDSPAPLGLLLPGKPDPRPCRWKKKKKKANSVEPCNYNSSSYKLKTTVPSSVWLQSLLIFWNTFLDAECPIRLARGANINQDASSAEDFLDKKIYNFLAKQLNF